MSRVFALMLLWLIAVGLSFADPGICREMSSQEIMEELNGLKARIERLEEELIKKDREIERLKTGSIEREVLGKEEEGPEDGFLERMGGRISINGLVEVGAAYEGIHNNDGTDEDTSDINLTTIEIGVGVELNDWLNLETVFLYEDPFGNDAADESDVTVDSSIVNIGNAESCPFYVSAGKMYVPFGAMLTHLPDDPLVEQPMSLLLGETSEKALLLGFDQRGINVSGYVFNGDMDESSSDNTIENFGFDANFTSPENYPLELFAGISYISNIADSDGLTDYLQADDRPGSVPIAELDDYVDGFAAYLHLGFREFFLAAEYMTALAEFDPAQIATGSGSGAEPSVWNIETGYNWNWGKNLEIVFKVAGSHETEQLGYPEKRYGIGFNQEIIESVVGSVAYFRDKFHSDDTDERDDRDFVCGQLAVEF